MSGINFFSGRSGTQGTAAVRALDKTQQNIAYRNIAREARVQELKRQYENGQYKVDSVQLSSAIVTDLLHNKL